MSEIQSILDQNQNWAKRVLETDGQFFKVLAEQQSPKYLWIGCADSRVPATQITDLDPGSIFVHRNIANLVHGTDLSALSVLQYSVQILKVRHIIVCGHYGCGGVKAAMTNTKFGLID
ncbi:MAG: carbonic anhydrase, partial [Planctomycetota bacterium]|nr:carbonic anhydrase [Planctomycetota bacterium]